MNKGQKLVQMLEMMTRRGGVLASELMERFELDSRTLRRYLADMRDLDVPIVDEGRGNDRIVALDPRWKRAGVQLTLTEVLSLHFGRTLFNFLEGTSFASDLDGALERLEPAISRTHADLARQLDTKFIAVPEHFKNYSGSASEIIDEAITALVYNNPIEARYRKPSGMHQTYHLHPYTLGVFRQGLYLFAYDLDARQVKTFALERFTDMLRRRERFDYPTDWDPSAHIGTAFGIIPGETEDVVLAFVERVIGYIRERTWHRSQTFRTLPDGRLEMRLRVAITVELETFIRGFGPECEVIGPPMLVDRIAASFRASAAQYDRVRSVSEVPGRSEAARDIPEPPS